MTNQEYQIFMTILQAGMRYYSYQFPIKKPELEFAYIIRDMVLDFENHGYYRLGFPQIDGDKKIQALEFIYSQLTRSYNASKKSSMHPISLRNIKLTLYFIYELIMMEEDQKITQNPPQKIKPAKIINLINQRKRSKI